MIQLIEQVTLDQESFNRLKVEFVGLGTGTATKALWGVLVSGSSNSNTLLAFGGERVRMKKLKHVLQQDPIKGAFSRSDRFWACCALDKARYPQQITLQFSSANGRTLLKSMIEGQEKEMSLSEPEDI
jgi:hypothetical protein